MESAVNSHFAVLLTPSAETVPYGFSSNRLPPKSNMLTTDESPIICPRVAAGRMGAILLSCGKVEQLRSLDFDQRIHRYAGEGKYGAVILPHFNREFPPHKTTLITAQGLCRRKRTAGINVDIFID